MTLSFHVTGGGNGAQAEPGTQLEDTWLMEGLCTIGIKLATQVDRGQVHLTQKSLTEDLFKTTFSTLRDVDLRSWHDRAQNSSRPTRRLAEPSGQSSTYRFPHESVRGRQ